MGERKKRVDLDGAGIGEGGESAGMREEDAVVEVGADGLEDGEVAPGYKRG